MKLLRDFFRLRTASRLSVAGRRSGVRVPLTVTVPRPLSQPAGHLPIDTHEPVEASQDRAPSRWHDHASTEPLRTSRHLQLVSSH
ncbi:hypothetical protein ISP15_06635 [Dyella jejuensis]|uniref:Uncharacterized protein n=1 Tax=Dyella jejuensis TaxID=1432009 RepID=A0ABW8JGP1_9GAMM